VFGLKLAHMHRLEIVGEQLLPNDAKVYRINLCSVIPIEVAPLSSSLAPWLVRYHLETKTLDTS
jgi:hypothetical protein